MPPQSTAIDINSNEDTPLLSTQMGRDPSDIHKPWLKTRYVGFLLIEQIKVVVPITLYLILFKWLVLDLEIKRIGGLVPGIVAVIFGLLIFIQGLKLGLMPLGHSLGLKLPASVTLLSSMAIIFVLGMGVTIAEPAIGALETIGKQMSPEDAPYAYALLNLEWNGYMIACVAFGVGIAAVLGVARLLYGWPMKWTALAALIPTVALTVVLHLDVYLRDCIGIAWDCGAVTTGPVTVPLILALGIGVARHMNRDRVDGGSALEGFGIVTLASLMPILIVMGLSIVVQNVETIDTIIFKAEHHMMPEDEGSIAHFFDTSPMRQIVLAFRAIVPLSVFALFCVVFVIKEKLPTVELETIMREDGFLKPDIPPRDAIPSPVPVAVTSANEGGEGEGGGGEANSHPTTGSRTLFYMGLAFCLIGMITFNYGLTYGLEDLGKQTGMYLPHAFEKMVIDNVETSARFPQDAGLVVVIAFAMLLGVGATVAEPALSVLGQKVAIMTAGNISRLLLVFTVSGGVGIGVGLGVLRIIFKFDLLWMIIGSYSVVIVLTLLSREELVCVAWDSAGVTTGPVTVPLVLALGVSMGNSLHLAGFGILTLASVGPIISVLSMGLIVRFLHWRKGSRGVESGGEGGDGESEDKGVTSHVDYGAVSQSSDT